MIDDPAIVESDCAQVVQAFKSEGAIPSPLVDWKIASKGDERKQQVSQ
jgi:hypothetical protein